MGFKLPGKSIHNGTSAHRSALKMKASALKTDGTYAGALKENPDLEKLIAERNKYKYIDPTNKSAGKHPDYKNNPAYGDAQNAINKAYYGPDFEDKYKGTPKEDSETPTETTEEQSIISKKGEEKKSKIQTKADTKKSEVDENVTKREAKDKRKSAKKEFGKGSKEHLEAKMTHLKAKEADRQGEQGGKKQSIFRRISSNINKKRQANVQEKLTGDKKREKQREEYEKNEKKRKKKAENKENRKTILRNITKIFKPQTYK